MKPAYLFLVLLLFWGPAAVAQEAPAFQIGGDRFDAGRSARSDGAVAGDVFLAGERVRASGTVGGAAHLAGRVVTLDGAVAGAVYAMGYAVDIGGRVGGNATLAGAEVTLTAPLAGNLRATASELRLEADVAGAALLGGGEVTLNGAIAGDAVVAAETIDFGTDARIGGQLTLFVPDPEGVSVPDTVAPASRVTIREIEDAAQAQMPRGMEDLRRRSIAAIVGGWIGGVAVVALTAAAAIAIAPDDMARVRARALSMPVGSLVGGFVVMSALVGAVVVLAFTLVGLLLVPVAMLIAGLLIFAGYVAGAAMLGVGIWSALGRTIPDAVAPRAGLAALGALVAGLLLLVPVLGWLAWFALVFVGLGALTAPVMGRFGRLSHAG